KPKPVVHVHPDKNVFSGEKVSLTCDIQQTRDWGYIWNKDGQSFGSVERDQNYIISSVDSRYDGVYTCYGSQSEAPQYSESSDGVKLTVSDLPTSTVTVTPNNPVFTGETVNMKCEIKSDHSNWRYEWYKGNRYNPMLQMSDHYTVNRDTLTIRGATESDQDYYWCKGQRDGRPKSSHFSSVVDLTVKDLPTSTVTVTPNNPVFTGETVSLKCEIKSDHSDWRYEWYKGNTNNRVMLQTSDHYTVNRDTLNIAKAISTDAGQYWCKGQIDERPQSSHFSSAVDLTVK
ncbi:hypothetical protein M9458_055467, partial [Cirrhinus mrigala]